MRQTLSLIAFLALVFAGCEGSSADMRPVTVIDLSDGGVGGGCAQPSFPSAQPDLSVFSPPRFLLTTSQAQQSIEGQADADPGEPIEAEITVNAATRKVKIELADAWDSRSVIYVDEIETPGNQAIDLLLFSHAQTRGRYFMKLTLCGVDCRERSVVFDVIECPDQAVISEPCSFNVPYHRAVFENGELVQEDDTCIDLGGQPGVGSGTILIQ